MSTLSPSVASASLRIRSLPEGMAAGFKQSPMGKLKKEYELETDSESSLESRATQIVSKRVLGISDIMDRGVFLIDNSSPSGRFGPETGFSLRTDSTVRDMQYLLDRANALRPGNSPCFRVDPHDSFMSVLKNAMELNEIHVAWMGLNRRMDLAQWNFEKYQSEYAARTDADVLLSPVSTDPELYDVFPRQKTFMSDVNYLFDNVPHHKDQLPANYQREYDWLPFHVPVPKHLQQVFPNRSPEERPSTVYYATTGERQEIALSARTSRGTGQDFEVPPPKPESQRRHPLRPAVVEDEQSSEEKERDERTKDAPLRSETMGMGMMGSTVQFKTPEEIFVPKSPRDLTGKGKASVGHLPNPLIGMASVSSYGDSISSLARYGGTKHRHARNVTTTAAKPDLGGIAEVGDEDSFHIEQAGKEQELSAYLPGGRPSHGLHAGTHVLEAGMNDLQNEGARGTKESGVKAQVDAEQNERVEILEMIRQTTTTGLNPEAVGTTGNARIPRATADLLNRLKGEGGLRPRRHRRTQISLHATGAPYGTMVPTIEPKVKIESLPEWDGNHDTGIDYFWDVGQIANLLGWLPKALGFWLPSRLKKDSQVQLWFSTLPAERQAEMRSHYLVYLQTIKDSYLGKKWQLKMNLQFEVQSFRQEGHEKESPQKFLGRRTRFLRLLAKTDEGGAMEVFQIMQKAPISWSTILVLENIKTSEELYSRVNKHEEALVEVFRRSAPGTDTLTVHNLSSTLKRLGFVQNQGAVATSSRPWKRANLTEAEGDDVEEASRGKAEAEEGLGQEEGEATIQQAYQVLKKRQRPPPKGGYPFSRNDHVTTKMGKAPPSPCKVCSSPNHWDRECPDWNVYIEKQKRGVLIVATSAL
ncbi:hypothetical protein C8R46DRAFT_1222145 [Mycena filopes]|nr:hypothetical protein C8R46DRAFT_1222145 [Mycena filopes]